MLSWDQLLSAVATSRPEKTVIVSPADLAAYCMPRWQPAKHLALIDAALMRLSHRQTQILCLAAPPRHGKSTLVTQFFPAWWKGAHRDDNILITSYGDAAGKEWSRKAKSSLQRAEATFGVQVSARNRSLFGWTLDDGEGYVMGTGTGGPIVGKGFNCVASTTKIQTPYGRFSIADLYRLSYSGLVLSFNHQANRAEWRHVVAQSCSHAEELVEVETSAGRRFRCTPEHRVFTGSRGYVAASDLRHGEEILGADVPNSLRPLPEGVPAPTVRRGEAIKGRAREFLLFLSMLNGAPRGAGEAARKTLRHLRQKDRAAYTEVLRAMQAETWRASSHIGREKLPNVPLCFQAEESLNDLLLSHMRQLGASSTYDGEGQLKLAAWGRRSGGVTGEAVAYRHGARPGPVRLLRDDKETAYSPRQSCSSGSPSGEYGNDVPQVSRDTPQVAADTIRQVRRVRERGHRVYDLQVEGNGNFFADGALVHNCIIIDDPVKNAAEARSPTYRQNLKEWFDGVITTRLEPGGVVLLTMQRWHEDDLIGYVLGNPDLEGVEEMSLPALAEEDEPDFPLGMGRQRGEVLWPDRWPQEKIESIRRARDPYFWSSNYQQRPVPRSGGLFNPSWFDLVDTAPVGACNAVRFWDFAGVAPHAGNKDPDWTASVLMAIDSQQVLWILDCCRYRANPGEILDALRMKAQLDGRNIPIIIELEPGGSTHHHLYNIQRLLMGWNVRGVKSPGSKVDRAGPLSSQARIRNVRMRRAPWNKELLHELAHFPFGAHDDMVDACSGAFAFLAGSTSAGFAAGGEPVLQPGPPRVWRPTA